jgi:hypothetical protein
MKISLVIESDNMEEFHRALVLLGQSAGPTPTATLHKAAAVVEELKAAQKPQPQPKPDEPKPQPDEPQPAAVVAEAPAEAPAEAKKGRGRPRKAPAADTVEERQWQATESRIAAQGDAQVNGGVEDMRANLMKVFAGYVQKYGTNFGYGDVSKLLQDNFGPDVRKSSDVTDENLVKAVIVVQNAIEANPYGRKVASAQ